MAFGVYVHIPYCLQRCSYCDFATYTLAQINQDLPPPQEYIELLKTEIRSRGPSLSPRQMDTIYFGGGTPSLIEPSLIVSVLHELENAGFTRSPACEVTIEINPATIHPQKMETYLAAGINRFSVGAQSFDDGLLKSVKREHDALQTRETLSLLQKYGVNFSVDILFALPGQTLAILSRDLDEALSFRPKHVSPYCLTVPEGHALSKIRPLEDIQVEMFALVHQKLTGAGLLRYEISNYCQPGYHSRHNSLYWSDDSYWGIGLSAHSYEKNPAWGVRYWNPPAMGAYARLIREHADQRAKAPYTQLPPTNWECLKAHEALTDFCHISLRRKEGLDLRRLAKKFGAQSLALMQGPLDQMESEGLLHKREGLWALTEEGLLVSNRVFQQLTFLPEEWAALTSAEAPPS